MSFLRNYGSRKVGMDSKDPSGRTPLSWAAGNGHEVVVKLLLNTRKVDNRLEGLKEPSDAATVGGGERARGDGEASTRHWEGGRGLEGP